MPSLQGCPLGERSGRSPLREKRLRNEREQASFFRERSETSDRPTMPPNPSNLDDTHEALEPLRARRLRSPPASAWRLWPPRSRPLRRPPAAVGVQEPATQGPAA